MERRSIDWIPPAERFGKVSSLGAIWFVGNINLTSIATGTAALSCGAGLFWTLLATVLGALFGTFFMALHSAQGPRLGLAQMVQSRAQFGYLGAALSVWVFALANYVAYSISDAILSGQALHSLTGVPATSGFAAAAALALLVALFGYRWIHLTSRWLSPFLLLVMAAFTVAALREAGHLAGLFRPSPLRPAPFMTAFVVVAGFQLGWAPYVSDYSRYLPQSVRARSAFLWTYLPSALSAVWIIALGAIVSAHGAPTASVVDALRAAGDAQLPGLGALTIFALLLGLLSVMSLNYYGGSLALISILDSFVLVTPTRRLRAVTIGAMALMVWSIAHFVGEQHYVSFYANTLIFFAYILTPWTAINLVDYFFVRRGVYVIRALFTPDGIYGRWGWRGNLAYGLGLMAMVPFFVTEPYTGPLARRLSGVDCSMFIGLPVSGLLYLWFTRGLDREAERRLAAHEVTTPNGGASDGRQEA